MIFKSIICALLLFSSALCGQIGGDRIFTFMNLVTSARVAAQGGSPIANPEPDLNFALHNPALLRDTMHNSLALSVVDFVSDITYLDAAYARKVKGLPGMFYGQVRYFDYGTFDRADVLGVRQGTFKVSDFTVSAGYSYAIDSNWRVGAKMKTVFSQYDIYRSSGLAFDFGATYKFLNPDVVISLLVKNAGIQLQSFNETRESLPFEIQLGSSYKLEHAPFRFQLTLEQLQQPDLTFQDPNNLVVNQLTGEVEQVDETFFNGLTRHMVFAAEFAPTPGLNLQIGFNVRRREELTLSTRRTSAGFSFGGGIRLYKFMINYARNSYHVSGAANHISITTNLNRF